MQLLLHRCHRHDALVSIAEVQARLFRLHGPGLEQKSAGDDLKTVGKATWSAERIPGGYVVKDATGQALACAKLSPMFTAETRADVDTATQAELCDTPSRTTCPSCPCSLPGP